MIDSYAPIAELYDLVPLYRERDDIDFYREIVADRCGTILELGCGSGRITLPIACDGRNIHGVDRSEAMLDVLRRRLAALPTNLRDRVSSERIDVARDDLGGPFETIIFPFRGFQHLLEIDDQLACLAAVRRALTANGLFVFDVFEPWLQALVDPKRSLPTEEAPFRDALGQKVWRIHRTLDVDFVRQVIDVELRYRIECGDGQVTDRIQRVPLRYFFLVELRHLLARSGFEIRQIFGDFKRGPVGRKTPGELIVLARQTDECQAVGRGRN